MRPIGPSATSGDVRFPAAVGGLSGHQLGSRLMSTRPRIRKKLAANLARRQNSLQERPARPRNNPDAPAKDDLSVRVWRQSTYRYWPAQVHWHCHCRETYRAWPGSSALRNRDRGRSSRYAGIASGRYRYRPPWPAGASADTPGSVLKFGSLERNERIFNLSLSTKGTRNCRA